MTDGFPEPEKPNPAVMPKNDKERLIWRAAVREAWAQGVTEADQLFTDNVSRMELDEKNRMGAAPSLPATGTNAPVARMRM